MREHLAQRADEWFVKARAASLNSLPCRWGCSQCCIGPFAITVLDVERIRQGMEAMPRAHRERLHRRALDQTASMERSFPRLSHTPFLDAWPDADIDALVTTFQHLPCPALESDGDCSVYPWRPLTCRMMGIPIDESGLVQGACQVQTAVPILLLPDQLRQQEHVLAEEEARAIAMHRQDRDIRGEEVLLPYGFLFDPASSP